MPQRPTVLSPRVLAAVCVVLFVVSAAFPLIAATYVSAPPPRWAGIADVVIAGLLVTATFVLRARHAGRVTDDDQAAAYVAARWLCQIIPALLLLFFVAGGRVNWPVLVIGLAWRGWLFIEILPWLVASRRKSVSG